MSTVRSLKMYTIGRYDKEHKMMILSKDGNGFTYDRKEGLWSSYKKYAMERLLQYEKEYPLGSIFMVWSIRDYNICPIGGKNKKHSRI